MPWYLDIFFIVKVTGNTGLVFSLAVLFLSYAPFYPNVDMYQFNPTPSPELSGALTPNDLLSTATKLIADNFSGPECVAVRNGSVYSGLADGRIIQIAQGQHVKTIVRIGGLDCEKFHDPVRRCGHPMGIRFDRQGYLYVADSSKGIYRVDVTKDEAMMIFNSSETIDGKMSRQIDDLVVSRNGDVYFTDASTKWSLEEAHYNMAELANNGRILHYDPSTKTTNVLLDELAFPSGIELSTDEDFLIFAQTARFNLMKYHLKGSNKGKMEVLVDNLPGAPDTLRRTDRGTFWLTLPKVRFSNSPSFLEVLYNCPMTRKVIFRLPYFLTKPFTFLDYFWPVRVGPLLHGLVDQLFMWIESSRYGLVVEVDQTGKILRSLHSPNGKVKQISTVLEDNNILYLGTLYQANLLQLPLNSTLGKHSFSNHDEL